VITAKERHNEEDLDLRPVWANLRDPIQKITEAKKDLGA
jgi:hypothetical protein